MSSGGYELWDRPRGAEALDQYKRDAHLMVHVGEQGRDVASGNGRFGPGLSGDTIGDMYGSRGERAATEYSGLCP